PRNDEALDPRSALALELEESASGGEIGVDGALEWSRRPIDRRVDDMPIRAFRSLGRHDRRLSDEKLSGCVLPDGVAEPILERPPDTLPDLKLEAAIEESERVSRQEKRVRRSLEHVCVDEIDVERDRRHRGDRAPRRHNRRISVRQNDSHVVRHTFLRLSVGPDSRKSPREGQPLAAAPESDCEMASGGSGSSKPERLVPDARASTRRPRVRPLAAPVRPEVGPFAPFDDILECSSKDSPMTTPTTSDYEGLQENVRAIEL